MRTSNCLRKSYVAAVTLILCSWSTAAYAVVTFSAPSPLNSNAATDSAHDFLPRIATDRDNTFVVVWASQDTLGGTVGSDYDIFFSRSTNSGTSWAEQ